MVGGNITGRTAVDRTFIGQENEAPLGKLGQLAEDVLALVVQAAAGNGQDFYPPPGGLFHLDGVIVIIGIIQMGRGVSHQEDELDGILSTPLDIVDGLVQSFIERLRVMATTIGPHRVQNVNIHPNGHYRPLHRLAAVQSGRCWR